jgi:uncharacterized membrane protein YcjF (UPF0283 family)
MDDAERLKVVDRRIDSALNFYLAAGKKSKWAYLSFGGLQIVLAAAVPIFSLLQTQDKQYHWSLAAAVAGALIAIVKGIDALLRTHETWLRCTRLPSTQNQSKASSKARRRRGKAARHRSAKTPPRKPV